MKKFLALLLCGMLAVSLFACGETKPTEAPTSEEPTTEEPTTPAAPVWVPNTLFAGPSELPEEEQGVFETAMKMAPDFKLDPIGCAYLNTAEPDHPCHAWFAYGKGPDDTEDKLYMVTYKVVAATSGTDFTAEKFMISSILPDELMDTVAEDPIDIAPWTVYQNLAGIILHGDGLEAFHTALEEVEGDHLALAEVATMETEEGTDHMIIGCHVVGDKREINVYVINADGKGNFKVSSSNQFPFWKYLCVDGDDKTVLPAVLQ